MDDILQTLVLPLLGYFGWLLPLGATLLLGGSGSPHFKFNRALLFSLLGVQALAFVPFAYALITTKDPGAWGLMIIPVILGVVLLLGTSIYFVVELIDHLWRRSRDRRADDVVRYALGRLPPRR